MSAADTNRVDPLSPAQGNGRDLLFGPLALGNTHSCEPGDGRLVRDAPLI